MARAGHRVLHQVSPDLAEMTKYLAEVIDRFVATDMMNGDPQVVALARLYDEVVRCGPERLFASDYSKGILVVEPSDLLLSLVAKFRAVENALREV